MRGSRPTTRGRRRGYRDTIIQGGREGSRWESASEAALKIHDSQREGRHVGAAGGEPEENQENRTKRRTREKNQQGEPREETKIGEPRREPERRTKRKSSEENQEGDQRSREELEKIQR